MNSKSNKIPFYSKMENFNTYFYDFIINNLYNISTDKE